MQPYPLLARTSRDNRKKIKKTPHCGSIPQCGCQHSGSMAAHIYEVRRTRHKRDFKECKAFSRFDWALPAKIELLWRKSPFVRSANPRSLRFLFETECRVLCPGVINAFRLRTGEGGVQTPVKRSNRPAKSAWGLTIFRVTSRWLLRITLMNGQKMRPNKKTIRKERLNEKAKAEQNHQSS